MLQNPTEPQTDFKSAIEKNAFPVSAIFSVFSSGALT